MTTSDPAQPRPAPAPRTPASLQPPLRQDPKPATPGEYKALITNIVAALVLAVGFISPVHPEAFFAMGSFALSGAITNWIAVHMLFEKVPGLYGSGIVQLKFGEFKRGIKTLMMEQFFTPSQIEAFLAQSAPAQGGFDLAPLADKIDYRMAFNKLVEGIMESSFGPMLGLMGGEKNLEAIYPKFRDKMREAIIQMAGQREVKEHIKEAMASMLDSDSLASKVEAIIDDRLAELTPAMVKDIIQDMIRSHLGWLVVWGGIFGGLIGLFCYILKIMGFVTV